MTLDAHMPALQVVVPLLTAPLVMLLRVSNLSWLTAVVTSFTAFAVAISLTQTVLSGGISVYEMGAWAAPMGIELRVDAFSALMLLIITGASSLVLLTARQTLNADLSEERQPLFYTAWLLALAGMSGIVIAGDAFNIFVFMEIASLASYILISAGSDRRALPAVFKYLIMGTIGATFYLVGVGLIYMMTGTLNLADMEARLMQVTALNPILVAAGFITFGLALKGALFPLHAWLPNGYTYAPHIVTAFLAACSTKVAIYVLLRFDFTVFQSNLAAHDMQFALFLMPLAVIAILIASMVAIFERNLKRLFAYSSIAQIGYIVLGASLLSIAGLTASIVHMFNHALAKGSLFLAIVCLGVHFSKLRLENLRGAAQAMPWTMAAFVLAGLSLIGVPGTAGFISKWYLISAAMGEGTLGILLVIVILISSLMAVIYLWRIIEVMYFSDAENETQTTHEAPLLLLVVLWVAALSNVYFGLNPSVPLHLASEAATELLGHVK